MHMRILRPTERSYSPSTQHPALDWCLSHSASGAELMRYDAGLKLAHLCGVAETSLHI